MIARRAVGRTGDGLAKLGISTKTVAPTSSIYAKAGVTTAAGVLCSMMERSTHDEGLVEGRANADESQPLGWMLREHRAQEIPPCGQCRANQTRLFAELTGDGAAVVFVHGSGRETITRELVAPIDRTAIGRLTLWTGVGNSQSEAIGHTGSVREDVADLAAMIDRADGLRYISWRGKTRSVRS